MVFCSKLIALLLLFVCIVEVFGDGYGHGHSYMMPGGSKGRKWEIRARGKGMQNMMKVPSYHHKEEKKPEVHYYPVPVHESHKEDYKDYKASYGSNHKIVVVPYHDYHHSYHQPHHYGGYHEESRNDEIAIIPIYE